VVAIVTDFLLIPPSSTNPIVPQIWTLYDRVVPGGIVYVDDYMGFNGCREAINEFRSYRRIHEPMFFVYEDNGKVDAAWWRKEN
jgi:Macrocin-O-methyltransferase (TylF)